ncbi:hypothetical protein [Rubrivirga sp.]|uniref:hypothetical protein n=1 Tax=Rubrivirga sp. TaxID=1885344 RepID=UPI003B51C424
MYALATVALWPIPVFGVLHAEASAVLAAVGCLTAAVGSVGVFQRGAELGAVARAHLGLLAVPLGLLTVSLLWRPNCGYLQGLGLFLVLVPPSVLFGLGLAVAITGLRVRAPRTTAAITALVVALAGVAVDLLVHPQLFTYSSVFGGVLGPIYDEELAIRPGLFAAKAQTLLWAVALVAVGRAARGGGRRAVRLGAAALAGVVVSVVAGQPLGIVQTERGIQRVLSARVDLGPVVLHLAPDTPVPERARLASEALFRFETLSARLGVRPPVPVAVYLYPDADTKAALIGSRETSVVPVWLPTPQVHMLADEVERSLGHELVHVLAREVGMPVVKASPAVGLVEGLAVALEPPDGLPDATALVVAGRVLEDGAGGLGDPADAVRRTMSPGGFWTARAGVAYTANGAFVAWLLDRFGAEPLRRAYRTGRFEPAYGRSLASLADAWAADLAQIPVDPEAVAVARWLFSRPSLFEARCPHHLPAYARLTRDGAQAWDDGDVAAAARAFRAARADNPLWLPALRGDLRARLASGEPATAADLDRAVALADSVPDAAALVHLADVRRLLGRDAAATYRAAADSLAPVDAVGRLLVRQRAGLSRDVLREWLGATPGDVPPSLRAEAPVLAALDLAADDRPSEAWALARAWCPDDLSRDVTGGVATSGTRLPPHPLGGEGGRSMLGPWAGPSPCPSPTGRGDAVGGGRDESDDSATEGRRVLRLLQGTMAYRAGALTASARLLAGLDSAFAARGPRSLAALAADRARRTAWRQSLADPPPIFADPQPAPDALTPCSAARRPAARDGLRAP